MIEIKLRVLSLGAGVQSSTLALMAAHGEIGPMPDCAIFADTGWEPAKVYEHLAWLETRLPFPVYRVRREGNDLGEHAISIAHSDVTRTASPPWYTQAPGPIRRRYEDPDTGEEISVEINPNGMLPKQCSKEFKIRVIQKKVRELLGLLPRQRGPKSIVVEQWIGISLDECDRMKPSELAYVQNRWPLIEKRLSRRDCLKWMRETQYPQPPKSSCVFCPYRGDAQWRDMRDTAPDDWERAVEFDRQIRPGFFGMQGHAFLHRQRVPLDQVDLRTDDERGQPSLFSQFSEECEGVCGV